MLKIIQQQDKQISSKTIVYLYGSLNHMTTSMLFKVMNEILEDYFVKEILLDFKEVDFIDSSGVETIKELMILSKEKGIFIELDGFNEYLLEVLLKHFS